MVVNNFQVFESSVFDNIILSSELKSFFSSCASVEVIFDLKKLQALCAPVSNGFFEIGYCLPDGRFVKEAYVSNAKNGIVANYYEDYMRRRDPETMLIGDNAPTNKVRYSDVYAKDFSELRQETFEWLKKQELLVIPFIAGHDDYGVHSLAVIPKNAAFFGFGLGLLQGTVDPKQVRDGFKPKCFLYLAPPFRHTHFKGKQAVVHNRSTTNYEIFSYNLYPGPSAKKGVYGVLLHFGEVDGWLTNHAAVVKVVTPYGNKLNIMHEGASGGGKSEMNQHIHREFDGSVKLGRNTVTNEKKFIVLPKGCYINPVADDMALAHPLIQKGNGKLGIIDAENGWFIRVDHITNYGTDPDIESATIHPKDPLLFLNIDASPGGTALLWEPIIDSNSKPCSNPRVILPKKNVVDVLTKPVYIDVRSFGVRTPPCTHDTPTYGVVGLFQILPPAIAWLWRLVSPRGFDNPSIVVTEGMSSEGVGSYWPFATGLKVAHANLLLKQIIESTQVHYALCPVKHIGAWEAGFVPEWIMREYLSRRGGMRFNKEEISYSGALLLGYSLEKLVVEGQAIDEGFLKVKLQKEVGEKGFNEGVKMLSDYFKRELTQYLVSELDPLGKKIIDAFMNDASIEELEALLPGKSIYIED